MNVSNCYQEEITTIYMYTLQPSLLAQLTSEDLDAQYEVFSRRIRGTDAGPLVNGSVAEWERDFADSLAAASAMQEAAEESRAAAEQDGAADSAAGVAAVESHNTAELAPAEPVADAVVKSEEPVAEAVPEEIPAASGNDAMDVAPAEYDPSSAQDQDKLADIASLLASVTGAPVSETVAEITQAAPSTTAAAPGAVTVDLTVTPVIEIDGAASTTDSDARAVVQDRPREVPPKPTEPSLTLCPMVHSSHVISWLLYSFLLR
jgi:hypothetical protein